MRWVLVVLLVLVMVAAGCAGDDDDAAEDATTTTAAVGEAEVLTTGPRGCEWTLTSTGGEVGNVSAWDAGTWVDFSNNPYDFGALELVAFDEEVDDFAELGKAVSGHPSLSDGVLVHPGGFGQIAFWVPPVDEYLSVTISPAPGFPDDDVLANPTLADQRLFQTRSFGVADRFLQELGWLG